MSALTNPSWPAHLVSVDEFAAQLRKFPAEAFSRIDSIREFQRRFTISGETLNPYLFWDSQHYTRNLIDKTSLYELIAICWDVGQASAIHNHSDQNCWMVAPVGRLRVQNYRTLYQDVARGTCRIEPIEQLDLSAESPIAVNPLNPVHKVYNPREFGERAVSVHIYSRPFDSCIAYSEEQSTCGMIKLTNTSEFGMCKDPRLQARRG